MSNYKDYDYCKCEHPILESKWCSTNDAMGTIFLSYRCFKCGKLEDEINNILYGSLEYWKEEQKEIK